MIAARLAQKWPYSCRRAAVDAWLPVGMAADDAGEREPPLVDLLEDPIVRALMTSDGVERRDLERLLATKRRAWFDEAPR
jgi:hypothetical protein